MATRSATARLEQRRAELNKLQPLHESSSRPGTLFREAQALTSCGLRQGSTGGRLTPLV